jgi:hypothetical protein
MQVKADTIPVQTHMKLNTPDARDKAWNMVKLMETVSFGIIETVWCMRVDAV